MTLADNARALQGTDDAAAVVAMATASFERDADVMRDMGLGSRGLDALVKAAGDDLGAELELHEVDVSDASALDSGCPSKVRSRRSRT